MTMKTWNQAVIVVIMALVGSGSALLWRRVQQVQFLPDPPQALPAVPVPDASIAAQVDAHGIRVQGACLVVSTWGRAGAMHHVPSGRIERNGGKILLHRPGLREEIHATAEGLRHDIVVLERPAGDGHLQVQVTAEGGVFSPRDERGAVLTIAGRCLGYDRLLVLDADGRALPAQMSVVDGAVRIGVDDAGARYPVVIDPTIQGSPAMALRRYGHTTTVLADGRVLVTGGYSSGDAMIFVNACEIFDPKTGVWSATAPMAQRRMNHTATLLPSGRVLVVGGENFTGCEASCEIFDPMAGTWQSAAGMSTARANHNAVVLPNGELLVAGGRATGGGDGLTSCELFEPDAGRWRTADALRIGRHTFTLTPLGDGTLLATGGHKTSGDLASCEIYDTATGQWEDTASMASVRMAHAALRLANGNVMVTGDANTATTEVYDPVARTWTATGAMSLQRAYMAVALAPDGKVWAMGGWTGTTAVNRCERFDPATGQWTIMWFLSQARGLTSAAVLPTGRMLLTGGVNADGSDQLATCELYDPATPTWSAGPAMADARVNATATVLPSGKVLIAGGQDLAGTPVNTCELYDQETNQWTSTGSMATARRYHTATLLPDGRVLVAGGESPGFQSACEFYDPVAGTWSPAPSLLESVSQHAAALLADGRVLIVGGYNGSTYLATCEVFDPVAGSWSWTGGLPQIRHAGSLTLLANGNALLAGGYTTGGLVTSLCLLYDPQAGNWALTGALALARATHTATLLPSGKVLVAGGGDSGGNSIFFSEVYDPTAGTWGGGAVMGQARRVHTAACMSAQQVLVAGGYYNGLYLAAAESYDPSLNQWRNAGSMSSGRMGHAAAMLPDGSFLQCGGSDSGGALSSTDVLAPRNMADRSIIGLTSVQIVGGRLLLEGSGFVPPSDPGGGDTRGDRSVHPIVQVRRLDNGRFWWLPADPSTPLADTAFAAVLPSDLQTGPAQVSVILSGVSSRAVMISLPRKWTWTGAGGDGSWDTPANWRPASVPPTGALVELPVAGTITLPIAGTAALAGVECTADVSLGPWDRQLQLQADGTITVADQRTFVAVGPIAGTTWRKMGRGHLRVSANNAYTGKVTLAEGTMLLDTLDYLSEAGLEIGSFGQLLVDGSSTLPSPARISIAGDLVTSYGSRPYGRYGAICVYNQVLMGPTADIDLSDDATIHYEDCDARLSGTIDTAGHRLTFGVHGGITGRRLTLSSQVGGGGDVLVEGGGILEWIGNATYTGALSLRDGSLQVVGTHTSTGDCQIAVGSILSGTGQLAAAPVLAGTVSPGDGLDGANGGTLRLGGLTMTGGSARLRMGLGSTSDQLVITGNATVTGTLELNALIGCGPGTYDVLTTTGTLSDAGLAVSPPGGYTASTLVDPVHKRIRVVIPAASVPVINPPLSASGFVGVPFTYQINASNGPQYYTASGLPSGLVLDQSTGLITGVPTTEGTTVVSLGAVNGAGMGTANLTLTFSATIVYVDADATGAANGTSWTDAYPNLSSALSAAVSGQDIWVAEGIYRPGVARTSTFSIPAGVAVRGGFTGNETSASQAEPKVYLTRLSGDIGVPGDTADNAYHVVTSTMANSYLIGLVIEDGNANGAGADGRGGGVYGPGFVAMLKNCIVQNNAAVDGGGVYVSSATWSHQNHDTEFINNRASGSGGAYNAGNSVNPFFERCIFSGNSATINGGAVLLSVANSGFVSCLFIGNQAANGGAIHKTNTIGWTYVADSTIFGNIASGIGGGLHCLNTNPSYGFAVANNILWGNTAPSGAQIQTTKPAEVTGNCIEGGFVGGSGTLTTNPLFNAPGDPDGPDDVWRTVDDGLALLAGSPCLDLRASTTTDLLGVQRPLGSGSDLGAYEYVPKPVINSTLSATATVSVPFSYQITATHAPTSYDATGLPAGLSINTTTGAITGTPTAVGTTDVSISATNANGTGTATLQIVVSAVPSDNLVAYWPLNGDLQDQSGNAHHLAITGNGTSFTDGPVGQALHFQAQGAYAMAEGVYGDAQGPTDSTGWTVSAWVRVDAIDTAYPYTGPPTLIPSEWVIGTDYESADYDGPYGMSLTASGMTVGASMRQLPAAGEATVGATTSHGLGTWIHVAQTVDPATHELKLYASGALVDTSAYTAGTYIGGTGRFFLGSPIFLNHSWTQKGGIDEVRVYRRALNAAEVATLHGGLGGPPLGAPVITSATTASGTVSQAFSYQVVALNTPTTYAATGLPDGLSIDPTTGLISGTPTTAGSSNATVTVTNPTGSDDETVSITIASVVGIPVVTSSLTATATVGVPFSYQITATNAPTGFSASDLPAGLSLDTGTGEITGTPTTGGVYPVGLGATNVNGTGNATLEISVAVVTGLKGLWRLDEGSGTSTSDASGNGRHGTLIGSPVWQGAGGWKGSSYLRFVAGSYVQIGQVADITGPFTLALWMRHSPNPAAAGTATYPRPINAYNGVGATTLFNFEGDTTHFVTNPPHRAVVGVPAGSNHDRWYHLAVTGDASRLTSLYLDGVLVGSQVFSGLPDLRSASWNIAGTGSEGYLGDIDEVRVYNTALSAAQVADLLSTVSIAATDADASGPADTGLFTLTRTGDTSYAASIQLAISGTAVGGTHYAPISSVVSFAAGQTEQTVQVTPLTGAAAGTVVATIIRGDWYGIGTASSATVTIAVVPPPSLTGVAPGVGPITGGTALTLTGTNLANATSVTIGGAAATSVVVVNATTITCVTPAGSAGAVDVVVTTPGGSAIGNDDFTYVAEPAITSSLTANGTAGQAFSYQITATNVPTAFTAVGLPAGLSLDPGTGWITGTPLAASRSVITLGASNAGGSGTADLVLTDSGPTLSAARTSHTATRLASGRVLVAGGVGTGWTTIASCDLYDPTTDLWTPTAPLAQARGSHVAALLGSGQVLVVGGSADGTALATSELYDPASGTWSAGDPLPATAASPTLTELADGDLLLAGGYAGGGIARSACYRYDQATGLWGATGSLGVARFGHTATRLPSGLVLVTGGADGTSTSLDSCELFDPATDTWSPAAAMSEQRKDGSAALLGSGTVLVLGGFTNQGNVSLASCLAYDIATGVWSAGPSLASSVTRYATATRLPDGGILHVGGQGGATSSALVQYGPVSAGPFLSAANLATPRDGHTATLLMDGDVLVVGGRDYATGPTVVLASHERVVIAPEMALSRGGTPIADGGTDAIGAVAEAVATSLTYVVDNDGIAALATGGSASISALVNCTATLVTLPAASVPATGSTNLVVTVTPLAAGAWSLGVSLGSDDPDEAPYDWTISGTATAALVPELELSRSAAAIADGASDAAPASVAGQDLLLTYDLANSGTAPLTLVGAPLLTGLTNCTATVTALPTSPVGIGMSTPMTVTVRPTAAGAWSLAIAVANDDADEDPYDWTITGTATAPDIEVAIAGVVVANGGSSTVSGTAKGESTAVSGEVRNVGTAPLTLTGVVGIGDVVNCVASISTAPSGTIAAGASVPVTVTVIPNTPGTWSCTATILSNDPDENPFTVTLTGAAANPGGNTPSNPNAGSNSGPSCGAGALGGLILLAMAGLGVRRRQRARVER